MEEDAKKILEIVNFIKTRIVTSDQLAAIESKVDAINYRLLAVESKIDRIGRHLDTKPPDRVADLEVGAFGQSPAPKHSAP